MPTFLLETILPFLAIISVLVFFHEWGHFLAARSCGVAVLRFSIGFGPGLYSFVSKKGTEWRFALFPLGGYVKLAEKRSDLVKRNVSGKIYDQINRLQKIFILASGPAANASLALVLYFIYYAVIPVPFADPVIKEVASGSPAAIAGIEPGDRVLSVNGARIKSFGDILSKVAINLETPLEFVIERDGATMVLTVTPTIVQSVEETGRAINKAVVGIASEVSTNRRFAVDEAATMAVHKTGSAFVIIGQTFHQIFSGQRSTDDTSGIIGLAQITGTVVHNSGFFALIVLTAMISVNLALLNLLPIPLFDGGQILVLTIESVLGKPLHPLVMKVSNYAGLAMIVAIFAITTWNDIASLVS